MPHAFQRQGIGQGGIEVEEQGVVRVLQGVAGVPGDQGAEVLRHGVPGGVRLEQLDQRVLIQHELAGVHRVGGVVLHAGHVVQQAQVQEGLGVRVAAAAEAPGQLALVVIRAEGQLAVEL